jgi:hypothetical protein
MPSLQHCEVFCCFDKHRGTRNSHWRQIIPHRAQMWGHFYNYDRAGKCKYRGCYGVAMGMQYRGVCSQGCQPAESIRCSFLSACVCFFACVFVFLGLSCSFCYFSFCSFFFPFFFLCGCSVLCILSSFVISVWRSLLFSFFSFLLSFYPSSYWSLFSSITGIAQ